MDNGEKERAIIRDLKETVRLNSGRRKAATQASNQPDQTVRIAPRTLRDHAADFSPGPGPSHQLANPPLSSRADAGHVESEEATVSVRVFQKA